MYRITKIAISLIIVLAIGTTSCYALEEIKVEQGSVLSLRDCIAIALNNNPGIKSARYNYGISKANVNIARSEFFPTVGIGTGYNFNGVDSKRTTSGTNTYSVEAQLNQLLWNFGRTNAHIKMQKFYLIADKFVFDNTVRETILMLSKSTMKCLPPEQQF